MAYFWRCPECGNLYTFDDDEDATCPTDGRAYDPDVVADAYEMLHQLAEGR